MPATLINWRSPESVAVRVIRVLLGAFGGFAVVRQATLSFGRFGFSVVNFFSYFTILSNIFADVVLVVFGLFVSVARRGDSVRGAVTLYVVITGLLYNALLRSVSVGVSEPWLNEVLHVVIPVVMVLDWIVVPQSKTVSWRLALSWLAFPLAYLAYSWIRGPIVHWYPYPFIDPTHPGGYWRVIGYAAVLSVVLAAAAVAVAVVGERASRWGLGRQDAVDRHGS